VSEFSGDGYQPFPNLHSDNQVIGQCSEWEDDRIENMVTDYWQFLERSDIQPRAIKLANRVLEHLGFEMDFRYGAYDSMIQLEDSVCDGA
jgi:hypothetical protein